MNDITLEQVGPGQEVHFFLKPADKHPHCVTKVINADTDDRDRAWISLQGLDEWVPLYHVRLISDYSPEEKAKLTDGRGLPGPHILSPVKGIDY